MKTTIPLRPVNSSSCLRKPWSITFITQRGLLGGVALISLWLLTPGAGAQDFSNTRYGANALDDPGLSASFNSAFGYNALTNNTSGGSNTASGAYALAFNTTGRQNTAVGSQALYSNQTGGDNIAVGAFALVLNQTGSQNTAIGLEALYHNRNNFNTATGYQALYSNFDGSGNVADGWLALYSNTSGIFNTAMGVSALRQNTAGNQNTAMGTNALYNNTGSNNVALGFMAGQNLTTGSNNVVIGANLLSKAGESNTTRIGKTTQAATYIGGIYNKTVASASGVAVRVDSTGKLGTVLSSARYKENIKPMDKASEAILRLDPVTFTYKKELDPDGVLQFGLVAEQVEKVDPDLVVRDEDGKFSTVRYEAVNAMLLNEFLKAHRKIEGQAEKLEQQEARAAKQEQRIANQQKQIERLTAGLKAQAAQIQKVSAEVQAGKSAPQLVAETQ